MGSGEGATVSRDMANPYHPQSGDTAFDDFYSGGTIVFDPAVGTVLKGNGSTKQGALGVHTAGVDDPTLAMALNALFFSDEERWPEEGGSNIPLSAKLVDSPEANIVTNFMGRSVGYISGIPEYPAAYTALAKAGTLAATDAPVVNPASGTIPYVNPAGVGNPDAIIALNYLLDDANYAGN